MLNSQKSTFGLWLLLNLICCSSFGAGFTSYTQVKNEFVNAGTVKYAYRKIGKLNGKPPVIMLMHTRGNLDSWDPKLLDALARERLVIAFDNKGVGLTNGIAPQTFEEMADDAVTFVRALGYKQVDIFAFSIGGCIAQEILIRHPEFVRRAVLAGNSAKGGDGVNSMSERSKAIGTKEKITDEDFLYSFFAPSETSQALGREFLLRLKLRKEDRDTEVSIQTAKSQAAARELWGHPDAEYAAQLKKIHTPVLILNGKQDIRMPTINSYKLFESIDDARLVLYPDSGHGFLFQYPELVAVEVQSFL